MTILLKDSFYAKRLNFHIIDNIYSSYKSGIEYKYKYN